MANTKNLKARPKASPSRLQENLRVSKAIVDQEIVSNQMIHLAEDESLSVKDLPECDLSVPLEFWLEHKAELVARPHRTAVQLGADQELDQLVEHLGKIDMVVLAFVSHVDGRGYSHAHLLRERHGYQGQIRAIGDVKFDQLGFLSRVGCNAFELPETENLKTALHAFKEFSTFYQPATDGTRLVFSSRRAVH